MQTTPIQLVSQPPPPAVDIAPGTFPGLLSDHIRDLTAGLILMQERSGVILRVGAELIRTLRGGGKVLIAGNGGSAAQAQHFATELVGRFKRERAAYAVLALTADSSALTAIANDYGFDQVFSRQVEALGLPGDVLVAMSTSGESDNVVRAADVARARGLTVVAITGRTPCRLQRHADLAIGLPARDTALIQELHMVLIHLLCDLVETELATGEQRRVAQ